MRNKWAKENLLMLENYGSNIVDFDCIGDRLIILFDNFTIRECSLTDMQETRQVNLSDYVQSHDASDVATGFALDKELGAMAISTHTGVHIFDYQSDYAGIAKIDMSNVI